MKKKKIITGITVDEQMSRAKKILEEQVIPREKSYRKSIPPPPKPPLCRIVREGTVGTCPRCNSTELRQYNFMSFSWGKYLGCINPDCENYHLK